MFKAAQVINVEVVHFKFTLGSLYIPKAFLNLQVYKTRIQIVKYPNDALENNFKKVEHPKEHKIKFNPVISL